MPNAAQPAQPLPRALPGSSSTTTLAASAPRSANNQPATHEEHFAMREHLFGCLGTVRRSTMGHW